MLNLFLGVIGITVGTVVTFRCIGLATTAVNRMFDRAKKTLNDNDY